MELSESTKKALKIGAIAVGVGVAAYFGYKMFKKSKSTPKSLGGVGRKRKTQKKIKRLEF